MNSIHAHPLSDQELEYLDHILMKYGHDDSILDVSELDGFLLALLQHALRNPGMEYTVRSHQGSHGITQQTARTDLLKLWDDLGFLQRIKVSKKVCTECRMI